jgi:NAD-dependent dihydropyrimidine dehydrogenase PreA subunit
MSTCRIVISKDHLSDPERHDFEETLAEQCAAAGLRTLVVPDIYHIPADANAVLALRDMGEPIILLSWHWPRAAFWTLQQFGVKGERVEVIEAGPYPGDGRPIVCLDMGDKCCPGRWMDKITELLGGELPESAGKLDRVDEAVGERWYPVIDYSRCTGCKECLEFCLFGVFDTAEDSRVAASAPDACKPGCPACSRVCPEQAIMFPMHDSDAAIAGSDDGEITPFDPSSPSVQELKQLYQEGKASIQDVLRACGCKTKSLPPDRKAACCPDGTCEKSGGKGNDPGYFDRLIDGLVKD